MEAAVTTLTPWQTLMPRRIAALCCQHCSSRTPSVPRNPNFRRTRRTNPELFRRSLFKNGPTFDRTIKPFPKYAHSITQVFGHNLQTKQNLRTKRIVCQSSASPEALPAPPETWPIEPPLEKVEHERYMYPADTLPGYVSHSKDPRTPVKQKTCHLRVRGAVGCGLCHWIRQICSSLKLDGWVKEIDNHNMEIVASGPSTAIDWLIGTLYRHPPDARVFQVVESEYFEPVERGFKLYELDYNWHPGGHEEMRGTDTFDFFGEETMELLWEVMYQEADRVKREAIEAEVRARERAQAEADAELDRRLDERDEEEVYQDLLSRALAEEGDESGLDDVLPRSYRRIEAREARKEALQRGGSLA